MGDVTGKPNDSQPSPGRVGDHAVDPELSTVLPDGLTDDPDGSAVDPILAALAATADRGEPELVAGTIIGDAFRIEHKLGAGGMGVVYLAHDTSLDRPVAVKLHRGGAGLDRLQREATAMARLSHPNVVTVHAVGRYRDDVFVAMEYVAGGTLRSWLRAQPRPWREALARCRAAGEGLAAAHAAGLIHRDFKPENVLLTEAGVPKVADFGLARAQDDDRLDSVDGEATPATDAHLRSQSTLPTARGATSGTRSGITPRKDVLSDRLTRTGATVGTPAYMAPEQFLGRIDVRADQFALAVVIWEALFGERPYGGGSARALEDAVNAGPPAAPRGAVPPAVIAVLRRALSVKPEDRFPTLPAMLHAIDRALGARRRRWTWIGAGLAAAAALALAISRWPTRTVDRCAAATAPIERGLPASLVARVDAALAAGPGDVARPRAQVARVAARLRTAAAAACRAGEVERSLAPELYARSRACLSYQALVAAQLIDDPDLLTRDPQAYARRLYAVPQPQPCLDSVALAANPRPPTDDAAMTRARLELVAVDLAIGRVDSGAATLAKLGVDAVRDRGNAAMATRLRGEVAAARGQFTDAVRLYTDAYYAGQAVDDVDVYLPSLAGLITVLGDNLGDAQAVAPWLRAGDAAVERDLRRGAAAVVGVLSALAAAADGRGDSATAIARATTALGLVGANADDFALAVLENNLSASYGGASDSVQAIAHGEAAVSRCDAALGASHPTCAMYRATLALQHAEADQSSAALDLARAAQRELDAAPGTNLLDRAYALLSLGAVFVDEPTERDRAERNFIEARALLVQVVGDGHPSVAKADADLAVVAMKRRQYPQAIVALERALAIEERALGPGHMDVGDVLFNLGTARLLGGDVAAALPLAERTVAVYAAAAPGTFRHAYGLRLQAEALTRSGRLAEGATAAQRGLAMAVPLGGSTPHDLGIEVARAIVEAHGDAAAARSLLTAARDHFSAYPDIYSRQLATIDALLARLK